MNILVSPLPDSVQIGGVSTPIKSGYRTGIQVSRAADSGLSGSMIAGIILRLYYGAAVPATASAALEAAMEFHRCGAAITERRGHEKRLLDWDCDAGMILADYRREYGIDLADESTRIHWWVFMAYFNHLSAKSETKTAMYYRSVPRPKDLKGADAKRFDDTKKAYALPPRTIEEASEREAALWGDAE